MATDSARPFPDRDPSADRVRPLGGYRDLLHSAYLCGRDDGSFAARFDQGEGGHAPGQVCRGRAPADFALLLWDRRPGEPPAGLELNAPLWYARGFTEALALAGREESPRGRGAAAASARG